MEFWFAPSKAKRKLDCESIPGCSSGTSATHSMENTSFIIANFSPGFSPGTGSNSFPISSCHFRLVGSLSIERHAASKSWTCMTRNKSCSRLKMEYLETQTSFHLDSNAGQTFRCAASYSASLPPFIRNRKATLGNRTSRLFPIQALHDRQEYMAYGKASTPTEKPWIINFSERSLVEAGG